MSVIEELKMHIQAAGAADDFSIAMSITSAEAILTELERLENDHEGFWEHLHNAFEIESRKEIEKDAKENWEPPNPLVTALHYIWKRNPKVEKLKVELERLQGGIELAIDYLPDCPDKAKSFLEGALTPPADKPHEPMQVLSEAVAVKVAKSGIYKSCVSCRGSGKDPNSDPYEPMDDTCLRCNGSGKENNDE